MPTILHGLFLFLLCLLVYTYFGYPLLLLGLNRWKRSRALSVFAPTLTNPPSVTLMVPVHNEERVLSAKLDNIAQLQYPGTWEVMFVLDGSTDRSREIIQQRAATSSVSLKFYETPSRVGKEVALRQALPQTIGEVLVFSDADSMYQPDVLTKLVGALQNEKVGAACGHEHHLPANSQGAGEGEGLFYRYENYVKRLMCGVTSLTYIQGGVFGIRRIDYPTEITPGLTQDGVIAFSLVLKGLQVVFVEDAISTEIYALSSGEDFRRRVRTITRAFSSVVAYWRVLLPWKTGTFGFHLISHRVLRWWLLPIMLIFLALNLYLIGDGPVFQMSLVLQILFYTAAFVGWMLERNRIRLKVFYVPFYFCYMHYAAMCGVIGALFGRRVAIWTPSTRA